ncbi:MAG: PA0069 family radical SAM protein [Alphaproteobacteria bacterium]
MDAPIPDRPVKGHPRKGRGAVSNPDCRYEPHARIQTDDGWSDGRGDGWSEDDEAFAPAPLRTTVTPDASRTVIARNDSPDVGFEQSINPYRGCEHGCVYCFARPTHAYLGLSPGLDFESRLFMKPDAHRLLDRELRRPGYRCRAIAMGTNTDPYQPAEREHKITRRILEVLAAFNHPVSIVTKAALVARDIDILAPMAERGLVQVMLSVTTLERTVARTLEPRAATPERRLETVRALNAAGIPAGVMVAPVIPGLTDHELERILERAREAGANCAGYILLRLPLEVKDLFAEWLAAHAPLKAGRVLSLVRQARGGRLNDPAFGSRMKGSGPIAELIARRFEAACRRLDLARDSAALDATKFRPPPAKGDQLSLL